MKIKLAVLTVLAVATCVSSFAQTKTDTGLSYNQVGIGYVSVTSTVSGKDYTFSGFGLGGSFLAGKNILLNATTLSANGDVLGTSVNISQTTVGVGARMPIAAQTDLYGAISYIDAKTAALGSSNSDNGSGFTIGIKTLMAPRLAGSIFAGQSKLSKSDSSSSFGLGLDYNISPSMLVGGSYVSSKDSRQFGLTLSYAF